MVAKVMIRVLFLSILVVATACRQGGDSTENSRRGGTAQGVVGEHPQMVSFSLPSVLDGKVVESREFAGRILLVTFFATWCPPCIQEIPNLIDLQNEFSSKGFTVLGLSVDDGSAEKVKRLVEKMGVNYPVLMADTAVAQGFGGVTGIPVSFLVDRGGSIVGRYLGYVEHDILAKDIKGIIAR